MNAPVAVERTEDPQGDAAREAWSIPLDRIDVSDPHLYQDDTWQPYFARLRRDDPVHYTENGMYGSYWSVTKYKRHHAGGHQPARVLLRRHAGRIVIRDLPMDYPAAELHLDGPAEARRATQGGRADRGADEFAKARRHDPRAGRTHPGRPAAGGNVRLGGSRVDRADHADAGDAVRLPLRRAAYADLLVRMSPW